MCGEEGGGAGMNEADTCRVLITPALQKAGWGDPVWRIAEQHYFTDGQIVLVGDGHKRQKGKKADYLLRYEESFPIAVVEAKAEELEPGAGLQQAKDYALYGICIYGQCEGEHR